MNAIIRTVRTPTWRDRLSDMKEGKTMMVSELNAGTVRGEISKYKKYDNRTARFSTRFDTLNGERVLLVTREKDEEEVNG